MQESGFPQDTLTGIREIVIHKLEINPDNHHDLDAIIASAGTDGLLDQDIIQAIINVEATI